MPACSRTVLRMPSAPTAYRARMVSPSSNPAVTPSASCAIVISVFGLMHSPAEFDQAIEQQSLGAACGTINEYG